jgi:hypothetical protein
MFRATRGRETPDREGRAVVAVRAYILRGHEVALRTRKHGTVPLRHFGRRIESIGEILSPLRRMGSAVAATDYCWFTRNFAT